MPFSIRPYRRFPVLCSMILVSMAAISLAGCISGTVSAVSYSDPPQPPMFIVLSPDSPSRTERLISARIEDKLSARGYRQATSLEAANIGVRYKYSVDPGNVSVDSNGQADWEFPRHFQIAVIDLQKSKMPEKIEVLWQGEVYSMGTSTNMFLLAPVFIEALFENYGETVTNKSFRK